MIPSSDPNAEAARKPPSLSGVNQQSLDLPIPSILGDVYIPPPKSRKVTSHKGYLAFPTYPSFIVRTESHINHSPISHSILPQIQTPYIHRSKPQSAQPNIPGKVEGSRAYSVLRYGIARAAFLLGSPDRVARLVFRILGLFSGRDGDWGGWVMGGLFEREL
jgi:hypothetical protein